MQRYRINYRLLIGLFVGTIVATISLFFLWSWQLNRKATWYRERSQTALKEDNKLEAFEYLSKFVKLRYEDDQARVELAAIAADVLEMEGVSIDDQRDAFGVLDQTVRMTGDPVARRKLADILFASPRPQDAIGHYEELLKTDQSNSEVKALLCQAQFRAQDFVRATATAYQLIGYDPKEDTFDEKKAGAPDQPGIYSTMAGILLQRDNKPELAERMIDQMVKVNPESAVAHLERSTFLYMRGKKDEAAAELEEANRLDPNSSDVLYRRGAVASDDDQFELAQKLASEGVEKYPDEMRFYRMLANAELRLKAYDKAIAALDKAITQFGKERSLEFLVLKIDVLLSQNDIAKTKEVIAEIEKLNVPKLKPLVDFQNARITFNQKQWAAAAQQLQRVRPQLVDFGRMQAIAGSMLGEAYENLGKLDLARQMFELVASDETLAPDDPAKRLAQANVIEIKKKLGLGTDEPANDLNSLVQAMLAKPEREQDWGKIDAFLLDLAEKRGLPPVQRKLLQAQVFSQRKMLKEAKDAILEAVKLDPKDISVRYAAVKLLLMEGTPESFQKALALLDRIESENGIAFDSHILKVETVAALGGDDVKEKLLALTEGTESFKDSDKTSLLANIGIKMLQLGDLKEATNYLNQAAELAPNNLPIRVQLFEIAFQQRDDTGMREAQKKILDLVDNPQDGNYVLTEVKRRLIAADGKEVNKESLREARAMLDDVLTRRPQWHELHVLYGQLLLMMGEETDLALQHLDDALKYGPPNPNAVAIQVKLLAQRGDLKQAREKMNFIPKEVRGRVLDRTEAAVLASTGEMDAAFDAAKEEAGRHPEDPATQAWFGSLASQLSKLDDAAAAYRKACDLNPQDSDSWMKLISVYAQQQNAEAIETVFREAQLALDPEFLPMIQAKFFELQGRWKGAEDIYFSIYKDQLNRAEVAQQMAAFYLLWAQVEPRVAVKAFPFLNGILRAANEGTLKIDSPVVDWAREKAALYLASTGRYHDSIQAERLLRQSSPDGVVPRKFQLFYSQILSSRDDPVSIQRAIETMSALNQRGLLSKQELLLLAKLYARTNNWKPAKALMLDALGVYGADPQVWSTYINLLVGQKEYTQAAQRLNRFAEISEDKFAILQLRAHMAHERGDEAEVKKLLRSMLPPNLGPATPLSEEQLQQIKAIAGLAVSFGDYELSENLLKLYVARKPDGIGDLVNVMALYRNIDDALPLMKELSKQAPVQIAQLGVQMLRDRRGEIHDRYDQQVADLVAAALRDDPDSGVRLVTRAEMYEVMEKYDEAIKAYEEVLGRDDLPEKSHAAVMNNLAFLLAQTNQRLDDSEKFIDGAIEILGPLADALDTRAVIRMARKEYPQAVEDMTLAISVDPSAVKYYHLAKAQALAGNADASLEAWQKAQDLGIKRELLPLIEQPGFSETEKLVENLKVAEAK